jgi:hypothetical protein
MISGSTLERPWLVMQLDTPKPIGAMPTRITAARAVTEWGVGLLLGLVATGRSW